MRIKFFLILALPFVLAACNKSNSSTENCNTKPTGPVAPAAEIATLKAWLDGSSLTYTQHPSGLFYKIELPGSGSVPTINSDVTVKYSGRTTTSNTPFDQNSTGITFKLGQLIPGWQVGIPLIQKGGKIILYIPPTMAYGACGAGSAIPPDSYLVFTIDLVNVQ